MTDPTVTIRAIYDAFARGDIATVLGALDPKIEWVEAAGSAYAGTYTGPDAVLSGVLARLADEWNPFHVAPDRIVADRDTVIAVGTYTGTHNASGRSVRARFAHVWELRDSNIIAFEQIADTAKINEAT
jgi:ketosteroid isomerase-like protein